jgi:hypothetical protein
MSSYLSYIYVNWLHYVLNHTCLGVAACRWQSTAETCRREGCVFLINTIYGKTPI